MLGVPETARLEQGMKGREAGRKSGEAPGGQVVQGPAGCGKDFTLTPSPAGATCFEESDMF